MRSRQAMAAGASTWVALALTWAAAAPPAGWRGDGSGKYPTAVPPTRWGRVSAAVQGLRFMARKPASGDRGAVMPDGVVRQWLVLGPVASPTDARIERDTLPGETQFDPQEGDETGGGTWRRVALDTAYLDFAKLIAKPKDAVAYACARLYVPAAATFRLNLTYVGGVRVCVNGRPAPPMGPRFKLDLEKGWNRVLLKVSRGDGAATGVADWYVVPVLHGWAPSTYEETNLAWRAPLPGVAPSFYNGGMGVGAPVIAGDRIYLLSEPHDLVSIRKSDGKVLWLRRTSHFEAATDEEKKHPAYREAEAVAAKIDALQAAFVSGAATGEAWYETKAQLEKELQKQMKRVDAEKYGPTVIPDVGFSGFTAASDGRLVYAWFGDGVTACYDPEGNRRWIRADRRPAVEHGFSSSPLLVAGKLVVFMRDLMAFDAATGSLAWQVPVVPREGLNPEGFFHGSPVAASIGGDAVIVLGNGMVVRAGDGKVLCADRDSGNQAVASAVVDGGRLFHMPTLRPELVVRTLPERLTDPLALPTRRIPIEMADFPKHYLPWHLSSPVIHQGLAYLVNNAGVLTVVDVDAGKVVYQKLLDLDVFQAHNEGAARGIGASPALAGPYLYVLGNNGYVLGNNGAALVLEPGRTYKQIGKNKIENVVMAGHWSERQERFVASPVFDGKRLYLRGEGNLYAVGPVQDGTH